MIDVEKELKKLFKDAMYHHLLHEGCTIEHAKQTVEMVFNNST